MINPFVNTLVVSLGLATMVVPPVCLGQNYTISTVAGGGNPNFLPGTGDGGSAIGAGLSDPTNDVAVDSAGNVYIASSSLVRKVTTAGIITTVAGGGSAIGDGVLASQSALSPTALAVDTAGNLYIADSVFGISRVRKVDQRGIISTIAGGAGCCSLGDGGKATAAYIAVPYGIAVDTAGNLYIAQTNGTDNLIRRVSASGIISTVAGGGNALDEGGPATGAGLAGPTGVSVDPAGNLYIAEAFGNRIRRVSPTGTISTVAGISSPWHITAGTNGNLFVTSVYDATVRMVAQNGIITTIAGNGAHGFSGDGGPATRAELDRLTGIASSSQGQVFIADASANIARVRALIPSASTGGAPPAIAQGGVISASAFGQFTSISPGSWIEIYGSNLSPDTRSWGGRDFSGVHAPTSLSGVTVAIGGQPAFLDFVSPGQIVGQVPSTVPAGTQSVVVTAATGASSPYSITVNAAQPGLLAPSAFRVGGNQFVAALFSDSPEFVLPPGAVPGVASRRARAGEVITLYGIGFGSTLPNIPAGQIAQGSNALAAPFALFIGGRQAAVSYAGLAPNVVGLYQFNVVVPGISPSDAAPLTFTLNGVAGTQTVFTAVQ